MDQNLEDAWTEYYALMRVRGYSASWLTGAKGIFVAGWEAAKFDTAKQEKEPHIKPA